MALTGVIFGVIAVAWLIYLVPLFLNRRDNGLLDEVEPGQPFSATVTIVRRGEPLDSAENGTAVVSTPLNRRAALRELAEIDRAASRRRRLVLIGLSLVAAVLGGLAGFGLLPWWAAGVPAALIALFLVVARWSVARMRRDLDARAAQIRGGEGDEATVPITVLDEPVDEHEHVVELTPPAASAGSLWEPIPITAPTYVSKPLAPRTVRTIDLSAPVSAGVGLPVVAEGRGESFEPDADADGRPWAVGE